MNGTIRVWSDKQSMQNGHGDPAHLDLTAGDLAGLLSQAQQDMTGFLTRVEQWASAVAPGLGGAVAVVIDEDLSIVRADAVALPDHSESAVAYRLKYRPS